MVTVAAQLVVQIPSAYLFAEHEIHSVNEF